MIFKSKARKRIELRNKIEIKTARLYFLERITQNAKEFSGDYVDEMADLSEYIAKLNIKLRELSY